VDFLVCLFDRLGLDNLFCDNLLSRLLDFRLLRLVDNFDLDDLSRLLYDWLNIRHDGLDNLFDRLDKLPAVEEGYCIFVDLRLR
jgi:hypothetical protein